MNYEQLKAFCNSLTPEQLQQEVYLSQVDDAAIKIGSAHVTEEDTYWEHSDGLGTLKDIKEENPDDWEDIVADANICPKGTVFLSDEESLEMELTDFDPLAHENMK